MEHIVELTVPRDVRDPELLLVPEADLEGDAETLGEPESVNVFSEVLDCVELPDTLLELETVEVCEELCVDVACGVCVEFTVIVREPDADAEPEDEYESWGEEVTESENEDDELYELV